METSTRNLIEQTSKVLTVQVILNAIGMLVVVLIMVSKIENIPMDELIAGYSAVLAFFFGAMLAGIAVGGITRGSRTGWVVALLAQLLTIGAVIATFVVGSVVGATLLLVIGAVVWIVRNLFRPQVRRHCRWSAPAAAGIRQ